MKNGIHKYVSLIPGSHSLVGPEERFSDPKQVALFDEVMHWFLSSALDESDGWREVLKAHLLMEVEGLSEAQCTETLKQVKLFIKCAGYDFAYDSLGAGSWSISAVSMDLVCA